MKFFPEPKCQRILTFEEQKRYLKHAGETLRDIMVRLLEIGCCRICWSLKTSNV